MAGRSVTGQVSTAALGGTVTTGSSTGSTTTLSHTVDAGTAVLFVTVSSQDSNDANLPITGVTFNGGGMTKAIEKDDGTNDTSASIWYLTNPTATTANVVVTATGNVRKLVACFNFSGIIQQAPEATASSSGTASSVTQSITPLTNYALLIDCASHKGAYSSIATGQILIAAVTNQSFEHNTTTYKIASTAGVNSMAQTWGSSNSYSACVVSFAPTVSIINRSAITRNTITGRTLLSI